MTSAKFNDQNEQCVMVDSINSNLGNNHTKSSP